jgi:hypothetical protein
MEIVGVIERIEHIGAVRANPVANTEVIASGYFLDRPTNGERAVVAQNAELLVAERCRNALAMQPFRLRCWSRFG